MFRKTEAISRYAKAFSGTRTACLGPRAGHQDERSPLCGQASWEYGGTVPAPDLTHDQKRKRFSAGNIKAVPTVDYDVYTGMIHAVFLVEHDTLGTGRYDVAHGSIAEDELTCP